ncbi:MAG: aspartate-semialdehyde dehydrogenase, partial [Candidatus Korobacteraceae bacterium]
MSQQKIPVGILGATGVVGQRFIQMLENHPWFEVAWLAASDRSAGQLYGDAAKWRLKTALPDRVRTMTVSSASPDSAPRVIFAALDAGIARELEPQFATAGCAVISNSSAFRMEPNVPLIIPEVNADHLALIEQQCWRKQSGGYIVTNSNCSAMGLVLALAPLHRNFGIASVFVTTMQAVSGAGYPGVASLDILGNVIPYIAKEEEKMEEETRKLLGRLDGDHVEQAGFTMTAHCNRVPVEDGHTESVSVKLNRKAAPDEVIAAFNEFPPVPQELPTAPAQPVVY